MHTYKLILILAKLQFTLFRLLFGCSADKEVRVIIHDFRGWVL